jgi:hypothetical protein
VLLRGSCKGVAASWSASSSESCSASDAMLSNGEYGSERLPSLSCSGLKAGVHAWGLLWLGDLLSAK